MKFKSVVFDPRRVKAGPTDGLAEGEFIVYPSTFTKKKDSYGDIVRKGAFANTIAEWKASGNTLPGLYGHRLDDPDFFVAGASEMGEDDHGWWVRGTFDLDDHPKANRVYKLVKGRRLNQLSFAFDVLEEGMVDVDGEKVNELRELKVYEFSFVPIGANQDTSVLAIKGIIDEMRTSAQLKGATHLQTLLELRDGIDSLVKSLSDLDSSTEVSPPANSGTDAKGKAVDEESEKTKSAAKSEEQKMSVLSARLHLHSLDG